MNFGTLTHKRLAEI